MTDFRALCAELVEKLDELNCHYNVPSQSAMIERACAALAEPEPEGPTDEELESVARAAEIQNMKEQGGLTANDANGVAAQLQLQRLAGLRAVLARWGNPAPQPVPVSERPWEREGWCAEDGRCWVWNKGNCEWWELVDSKLISYSSEDYTHCLPAHALPIPHQQETAND